VRCHLGQIPHLDAFVTMNDEKRSIGDIDKFLEENMPGAEKVFADALEKFLALYVLANDVITVVFETVTAAVRLPGMPLRDCARG
jgi:hypothetical protein